MINWIALDLKRSLFSYENMLKIVWAPMLKNDSLRKINTYIRHTLYILFWEREQYHH